MNSLKELIKVEQFGERPITIRKLLKSHDARDLTLRALFTSHEMLIEFANTPRWVGALGPVTGGIFKDNSGSYKIPTELGFLQKPMLNPPTGPVYGPMEALGEFTAAVDLAAIQCIGTEDPGNLGPNEDEVYGYISIFTLLPGEQHEVVTKQIGVKEEVKAGDVIFKNTPIGELPLVSGTNGFKIFISLWDEETTGPPGNGKEELTKSIKNGLATTAAGAAAVSITIPNPYTAAVAGITGILALVLENEWVRTGVGTVIGWLDFALADDHIGDKEFTVTPAQISLWSTQEGYDSSLIRLPDILGSDVSFNVPQDYNNSTWLLSGGGATYKAFFKVRARKVDPYPIDRG